MKTNNRRTKGERRSPAGGDGRRMVSRHLSERRGAGSELDEPCRRMGLIPRQAKVMAGIVLGKTDKEIGMEMGISHRTVSNHIAQILREMRVTTRSGAIKVLIDVHFSCPHIEHCKVRLMTQFPLDDAFGTG